MAEVVLVVVAFLDPVEFLPAVPLMGAVELWLMVVLRPTVRLAPSPPLAMVELTACEAAAEAEEECLLEELEGVHLDELDEGVQVLEGLGVQETDAATQLLDEGVHSGVHLLLLLLGVHVSFGGVQVELGGVHVSLGGVQVELGGVQVELGGVQAGVEDDEGSLGPSPRTYQVMGMTPWSGEVNAAKSEGVMSRPPQPWQPGHASTTVTVCVTPLPVTTSCLPHHHDFWP